MAGNTPSEAYHNFIDPMNRALNCLAGGRLTSSAGPPDRLNIDYAVTLEDDPLLGEDASTMVRLDGEHPLWLSVRHVFIITEADGERGPYKVSTIGYSYRFHVTQDHRPQEICAFQWNRDAPPPQRRYPHLHIGSLVASGSSYRARDFNRLHIPTGRLSLEAVLLFAIDELGVTPTRGRDKDAVKQLLRDGDALFRQWSTQAGDWY